MNNLLKLTLGLSTALAYSAYRRKQYRNTFHNQPPLITMNAHRAARQIVQATARRKANKTLTLPAQILARFHGLFPAATTRILTLVNRLLPAPTLQKNYALPGGHVESMMSPRNRQQLAQATRLGRHTDARP